MEPQRHKEHKGSATDNHQNYLPVCLQHTTSQYRFVPFCAFVVQTAPNYLDVPFDLTFSEAEQLQNFY